ncbi:putative ribonuclease H protein [Glycine max]|nr:putative ribonuclease H protein [Glycine max]
MAEKYPRLYSVLLQQHQLIRSVGVYQGVGWEWNFAWRRALFDNEITSAANFLRDIAENKIQQQGEEARNNSEEECFEKLWRIKVPARTQQEDASHLFFHCSKVQPIWWETMSWMQVKGAFPLSPKQHFLLHLGVQPAGVRNNRWQCWWLALTWSIWKLRNSMVFSNANFDANKLFEEAIFLLWSWLRSFEKDFTLHFNHWLHRFLVSEHWLSLWPESCQLVLQRNLSDHCPTILQTSMVDWGPKPFRVFDWWLQQKGYQKMVREAWNNDQQGGWGGIVLKNKLKNFKAAIKQWSKVEGNINAKKILNIQQKLNEVENLASHRILSNQELKDRNSLQQEFWNASNAFESLMTQKSRARWLNKGDCNTGYFHKIINCINGQIAPNGSKPFKVFDAWLKNKEYQKVVRDCWAANQLFGWGGFVLKNKLKILKARLKLWSKENAADMCNKMKQIQQELNDLENSMPSQPSVQHVQLLKKLQAELWEKANLYESTLRQKSRSRWIKEGDSNTNYFHKLINHSRRRNNLRGLTIDNSWVEDPNLIKAEILQHFQRRFHESQLHRPNLDGVSFNVILRSFELVSGLRINFAKSKFGAVGQSEEWCLHAANYLNCALLQFPFCYLGIPIAVNPKGRVVWDPVIRKFEDRLNRWNKRNISMAGRLTLIKAVLIALPLFYLSFFKAPKTVINRLSSIQRQFLWGGKLEEKKIAWVSWTQCCF